MKVPRSDSAITRTLGQHHSVLPDPAGDSQNYTTNATESLNMVMHEHTRNRRIFPNNDSALTSLFLAIREAPKNCKMIHHWKPALQSFHIMFGEDHILLRAP